MSRTLNGNLIGRAGQTAKRDMMNEIEESRQKFSQRWREAQNTLEFLLGDFFESWWDSYPEDITKGDFLPIMESRVIEEMAEYEAMRTYGINWEYTADALRLIVEKLKANPHAVEEASELDKQYKCENCQCGISNDGIMFVDGGSRSVKKYKKCPCCNDNWQDCLNCHPEGTGNDTADLLASMR